MPWRVLGLIVLLSSCKGMSTPAITFDEAQLIAQRQLAQLGPHDFVLLPGQNGKYGRAMCEIIEM
jgi:hypothetical protein